MDYDGRETLGMCAAGALGAGLGMLSYKYKKELGLFVVKTISNLEVVGIRALKKWLGMEAPVTVSDSNE